MNIYKHMAPWAVLTGLIVSACGPTPVPRADIERPLHSGLSTDQIYARRFALEDFERRLDSALNFHRHGHTYLYRSTRDSLESDVNSFIRANPHIETDPDFAGFFNRLDDLDSLDTFVGPEETYDSRVDSLALSFADWPELDVNLDPGIFSISHSVFPTVENRRVDFWIRYFTGPGRSRFIRSVNRMQRYRQVLKRVFDELDLPEELACVALIESGFSMKAVSHARAVGPWQFIRGTARIYKLRMNWWMDERRDIVASTWAAGHYLNDLHGIWGDWTLALAAYNCGEYRIARQIARQKTENFWQLRLPRQTQLYVPKFLAALYILRDPAQYDFDIPDPNSYDYDEVTVTDATDLKIIARCAGTSARELRKLNPQFRRWATPPGMEVTVRVPHGTGDRCIKALGALKPGERITWRRHRVRKGQTLSLIARKYRTSINAIRRLNNLRSRHFIREGQYLLVPAPGAPAVASRTSRPGYRNPGRAINRKALERYARKAAPPAGFHRMTYSVRDHDTLGEIAENYRTSARKIRAWNNLSYRRYIYPGQKLTIFVPASFRAPRRHARSVTLPDETCCLRTRHVVSRGESFYSISRHYGVSLTDLLSWNRKSVKSRLHPGDVLDVWKRRTAR